MNYDHYQIKLSLGLSSSLNIKNGCRISAIENGLISKNEIFECPGHFDLGDQGFTAEKKGRAWKSKAKEAISQSCDVYFWR